MQRNLSRKIAMQLFRRLPTTLSDQEQPLKFNSMYQPRVWGGRRLESVFGRSLPDSTTRYGESWELCDRPDRQSVVLNGPYAGCTLNQLWTRHRQEVFGEGLLDHPASHYPLLVKILDVESPLSVQVHPSADFAEKHGAEPKTEFWYVAEAEPSAHLYSGLRPGVSKEEFEKALQEGGCAELLNRFEVQRDQHHQVPSGRVHALGSGMLVFEIQQNSDTTYRLDDWGRLGTDGQPRELHVSKGLEAMDWNQPPVQPPQKTRDDGVITRCEHFEVAIRSVRHGRWTELGTVGEHLLVTVVRGQIEVGGVIALAGDCLLIPAHFSAQQRRVTCSSLLTAKWLEVRIPGQKTASEESAEAEATARAEGAATHTLTKPPLKRRSGRLASRRLESGAVVEHSLTDLVNGQVPGRSGGRKRKRNGDGRDDIPEQAKAGGEASRPQSKRKRASKAAAEPVVKTPEPERYALILAGGSGKRFWPWSRDALPKQLLPLFGGRCLLQMAVERLQGLVPPERILVLTSDSQLGSVRDALPELPEGNVIAEPCRRDTGAAIALGMGIIESRSPGAIVAVLPSDHLIRDTASFRADLETAMKNAAEHEAIVVLGIPPTEPSPAYGYIQTGRPQASKSRRTGTVLQVRRFVEKPEVEKAAAMLEEGGYLWNAGMFVLSTTCLRSQVELCAPWLLELLDRIRADYGQLSESVRSVFGGTRQTSFDYAVMEKAQGVLVLPARFDWNDLGTWGSYIERLEKDPCGNSIEGTAPVMLDSRENAIVSLTPQRVALLGVEHLVAVVTGDAILIADSSKLDQLKSLVDLMPETLR
jgi:mannose-1-phosphate guanylyltransferase/mannose-6-phosphate isomerase